MTRAHAIRLLRRKMEEAQEQIRVVAANRVFVQNRRGWELDSHRMRQETLQDWADALAMAIDAIRGEDSQ